MDEQKYTMEDQFASGQDKALLEQIPDTMRRMYFLSGLFYCSIGVSSWCLNMKGELLGNQYPSQHALLNFFQLGDNARYALQHADTAKAPIVLTDQLDMIWLSDFYRIDGEPNLMFVVGPMFNGHSDPKNLESMMRKQNISPALYRNLVDCLTKVPIISQANMMQIAKMLHYALTGETANSDDIHFRRSKINLIDQSIIDEDASFVDPGLFYTAEQMLLQLVREGDIHGRATAEKAFQCIDMDSYGNRSERACKNAAISLTVLASRAAVEGGLSKRTAKEIELHYVRSVESCPSNSDVLILRGNMLREFTMQVHNCRKNPNLSPVIQNCCAYIQSHICDALSLEEIAAAVGYTEYYLTKRFKKETGIRMVDYIKEEKIQRAKVMLMSEQSIQEISDELHFNTRSYFSKVFKKVTGMTPVQYRDSNGYKGEKS